MDAPLKMKIRLPMKLAASLQPSLPIEIPTEIDNAIEKTVDSFIEKTAADQIKKASLPTLSLKRPDTPKWIPAETPTHDTVAFDVESESIPEEYQNGADFDESPDTTVEETVVEYKESEDASDNYWGIPPESDANLIPDGLVFDDSQVRAIDELLDKQYGCLIGPAGSGKTTTTKGLVHKLLYDPRSTFKASRKGGRLNISFVAFTGQAVQVIKQNLPKWLHDSCMTIHSLLEFMPEEVFNEKLGRVTVPFVPQRNENNQLTEDMLIIDESSMLGMDLWNQLRVACKPHTKIIMIGDLNQLPPIIGEPIFAYALGKWPVSELTHIHRQTGGAGKIVEVAHDILNGRVPKFDKMKTPEGEYNDEWRYVGAQIDMKPDKAATQILATIDKYRKVTFPGTDTAIFDPYRDRIMTAGNGFGDGPSGSTNADLVQQEPLNEYLSKIIHKESGNPRYIIDAQRKTRHFCVGDRVMSLKNERPSQKDRVTNGMTGIIKSIIPNIEYTGDKRKVGIESEVRANMEHAFNLMDEARADAMLGSGDSMAPGHLDDFDMRGMQEKLMARLSGATNEEEAQKADSSTWASHTVTVEFTNGAVRELWSRAQIESLSLAYASTVAKCQGSQFPTAVVICHHAVKQQLSREWLYTAVTRAQGHVILLYTEFALRYALSKQKIRGENLQEKIERYMELLEGGIENPMGGLMKRNVVLEVGPQE